VKRGRGHCSCALIAELQSQLAGRAHAAPGSGGAAPAL